MTPTPTDGAMLRTFGWMFSFIRSKREAVWNRTHRYRMCKTCIYWRQEAGQVNQGTCWLNPPRTTKVTVPVWDKDPNKPLASGPCPMCQGKKQVTLQETGETIQCPQCGGEGHVIVEQPARVVNFEVQEHRVVVATTALEGCGQWLRHRRLFSLWGDRI